MLNVTERGSYVIVCIETPDAANMEMLVELVNKYPGKQILVSIGCEVTAGEIEAMRQNPLDFGKVDANNLLLSFNTIGGDYSGDSLVRRHRIPPTPSNNPQIGRYGPSKRLGR